MYYQEPPWGITTHKGIGIWASVNLMYGTLCIWLPFIRIFIHLGKTFQSKHRFGKTVNKKYFWYKKHFVSMGLYLDFSKPYGIRIPFLDIYLKENKLCII